MQKFITLVKESITQLGKVQTIAVCAMLAAMNAILGIFTIVIGEFIKIGFSFLTIAVVGMLYGPIVGGVLGGISDIVNYLIKPTGPFFPGFTINSILTGFIYGVAFYKKQVTIRRIFITKLIIVILVDLALTTTWLSMLYGQAFLVLLPMRALKSVIMLPINTGILYLIMTRVTAIFGINNIRTTQN